MKRLILIIIFGFIGLVMFEERDPSDIFLTTNHKSVSERDAVVCHVTLFNSDFIIPIGKFKKSVKNDNSNFDIKDSSSLINSMRKGLVWTLGLVDKTQKERRKLKGSTFSETFRIQIGYWDANAFNSERIFAPVWSSSNQQTIRTALELAPQGIKSSLQQPTFGYLAIEILQKGAWLETRRLNRYRVIYRFKSRRKKTEYFPAGLSEPIKIF